MKRQQRIWTVIFLVALFIFGISNVTEYGCPIDEPVETRFALMNIIEYSKVFGFELKSPVFANLTRISESPDMDHGNAVYYPIVPILCQTGLDTIDSMYVWHVYTYLVWFLGVLFLFRLLKELYHNSWTPFAGTCIYFFLPRIYAESHYNNKDIIFLSIIIIMLSFAVKALKRWKGSDIAGFAISSGFLMNCRFIGIVIWGFTGLFGIWYTTKYSKKENRSNLYISAVMACLVFFIITPAMWRFPVGYLQYSFYNAISFPGWRKCFLFNGQIYQPIYTGIPRFYVLQWILMTTPVYIIGLFIGSIILFMMNYAQNRKTKDPTRPFFMLFLITFILPVLVTVVNARKVVLFNGWRHNYYLYAYIILCSCYAVDWILDRIHERKVQVIGAVCAVCFGFTITDMMLHRSFEYMYFNPAARATVDVEGFEGDYWNVAELPAMLEFSKLSGDNVVKVAPVGYAIDGQILGLEAGNLKIVRAEETPDYFLFNTWMMIDKSELESYQKVYSFQKYGHELYGIYQKNY